MLKFLATGMVLALPLLANDRSKQTINATQTERFNVAAAGAIRLGKFLRRGGYRRVGSS